VQKKLQGIEVKGYVIGIVCVSQENIIVCLYIPSSSLLFKFIENFHSFAVKFSVLQSHNKVSFNF